MSEYRIEEAASRHEQQEAQLYRPDGSKVYGDDEHRERVAAIRREHDAAAFDRIEADAKRKVREAEQDLLVAESADPASALTTEESQRVSALSGFVADDVERLPLDALERRCRAALASGDRSTMFLLAHHAGRRAEEESAYELAEVVAELRAKIAPDQESRLADAREALEEAQALRERAYYRRRGVRDATDLYTRGAYWTAS